VKRPSTDAAASFKERARSCANAASSVACPAPPLEPSRRRARGPFPRRRSAARRKIADALRTGTVGAPATG
jgi:hypothetical protein